MGAFGQRLGLRLFLEGLEVPVVAAQVQITINSPATASIQIVPGDGVLAFRPRTMVHLFFWDYTMDDTTANETQDPAIIAELYGITVEDATRRIKDNPESFGDRFDSDLRGYRLLFAGEVIGVVFAKTPLGRQSVLQCSDFSTYWDTTYQFFISYSPGGNFLGSSAAVWAGGASMFDDLTSGHTSVMNRYLQSKPKTPGLEKVAGLMGGIISLLEAMGGVPNHTSGVNDFFTIAELKNHILQQVVAEQGDSTAQRLFSDKTFMDWLTRGMSSMGQLVTFRDMLKLLFKYIYYEVVPNPAAMYVPKISTTSTTKKISGTNTEFMPQDAAQKIADLFKKTTINQSATYGIEFESGHFFYKKDFRKDEKVVGQEFAADIDQILKIEGIPKKSRDQLELAKVKAGELVNVTDITRISTGGGNVALAPKEKPVVLAPGVRAAPKDFVQNRGVWARISAYLAKALEKSKIFFEKEVTKVKPGELDRLHSQIFRPDCFFAAAPRCNVLFPDQYTQFSFSRNFLQECTRLRLSIDMIFGINQGAGGLLATYLYAPALSQIKDLARSQENRGLRTLLPWEKYSGILPKFESMHEVNYVASRSEKKLGFRKGGKITGSAVSYAQRVANFNYMKYRFASRSCEVSAKFNPFMVCGFPMVVIDKPFIITPEETEVIRNQVGESTADDMSEFVRQAARAAHAPTQFIGMVAAMSHNVSQDSGGTSINMTHARSHRVTDDDFLDLFSKEITANVTKEVQPTVLDAETLLRKGDWRLLRFLRDATPQDLDQQAVTEDTQALEGEETTTDDQPIESRPGTAPASLTSSPFGSLLQGQSSILPVPQAMLSPGRQTGDGAHFPIRGKVTRSTLPNSQRTILVPDGSSTLKLTTGHTGPLGGKIVAIACTSNQAVAVVGRGVSKKLQTKKPVLVGSGVVTNFSKDASGQVTLDGNTVKRGDVVYFWKQITIYEELRKPKKTQKLLPVEEGMRPSWFSPFYSNWYIGKKIYEPFFGCGSIVDQSLFIAPTGAATFGTSREAQKRMMDELDKAGNDKAKLAKVVDDAAAGGISDVPDIESSIDVVAYIYGEVRRLGLDVNRFIQDYTRRPIATLEEILGSADLEYRERATTLELIKGTPGFHSTAVFDTDQLRGLLDKPDQIKVPEGRKGAGKPIKISRDLDPRPGRRDKVVAYLAEINAATGSLGVGVQG